MLSKLCHYLPLKILVNIYHSIFAYHMHYSCQIWGLRDNTNSHCILALQKAALRLITFSALRTPSNPIFSNLLSTEQYWFWRMSAIFLESWMWCQVFGCWIWSDFGFSFKTKPWISWLMLLFTISQLIFSLCKL